MTSGVIGISLLCAGLAAQAQTAKTFDEMLAGRRYPLTLSNGKPDGGGAERIRSAMRSAHFVLIGEDHGLAQIPAFSSALFDELAPLGFRNLVVEVGPTTGGDLDRMLRGTNPDAAMLSYLARFPFTTAFYNWKEEFDFLKHARAVAGPGFKLIGIDQELMGSSKLLLSSILEKHRADVATSALKALLDEDQKAYDEAAKTGNPMQLFMMTGDRRKIEAARDRLREMLDAESAALLNSLLASRDIYAKVQTAGMESNIERAELMKRSWVAQRSVDARGVPEKSVFKFGAAHVMKGLNLLNSREIGNFVAEVADGLGEPSVHILIMAARGNQLRFAGVGRPFTVAPVDQVGPGQSDFPFAKPLFEKALQNAGEWSVYDFREMRRDVARAKDPDARLVRMIFGFDFAVIIPEGVPSAEIR